MELRSEFKKFAKSAKQMNKKGRQDACPTLYHRTIKQTDSQMDILHLLAN